MSRMVQPKFAVQSARTSKTRTKIFRASSISDVKPRGESDGKSSDAVKSRWRTKSGAPGGCIHLSPTFIFPHPQGATESQSKALWEAARISRSQQHGTNAT